MKPALWSLTVFGIGVLTGCGRLKDNVTLEFATESALQHTSALAVTAFEPILRAPDSEEISFVTCEDIGPFPPSRILNPETIKLSNLVGDVLTESSETRSLPLDGTWNVSFKKPDIDPDINPWGAVMVFLEARGDARAAERGAGQVSATLLSGCYCIRTLDGGTTDPKLRAMDQAIRKACPLMGDEELSGDRIVSMAPVVPSEFHLAACDGVFDLTAPRNGLLSPGPSLCLDATPCADLQAPTDCFKCAEPGCSELDDKSNAPLILEVEQPGGGATPTSQVVLSDAEGKATAAFQVDGCEKDVTIRASIVGRTDESVRFEVKCADPLAQGFECFAERQLAADLEPKAITTVPASPGQCSATNPDGCEQVAVLYEDGLNSLLEVRTPGRATPVSVALPGLRAHAVHGFYYDEATRQRPMVAAVLTRSRLPVVYVFEWRAGQLVPHDGLQGELATSCGWHETCQRATVTCTIDDDCNADEACEAGVCRLKPCAPPMEPQSQISIEARDVDHDGFADLAVGNSGDFAVMFFYTSSADPGESYKSGACTCARFGQNPNGFALLNLGGPSPDPTVSDVVLGSAAGTFVRYAEPMVGGSGLTCGSSASLRDGMSVRDVRRASLRCSPGDLSCVSYDDAVVVSARGISGGSLDEPGFIRVLFGSSYDLTVDDEPLNTPGISYGLIPTPFTDRMEPRDPRQASLADFNGDGHQDLAVLYKASEEVHIWVGAGNGALGEIQEGPILDTCEVSLVPGTRCAPLPAFATPDLDGDGRAEVAVICDYMGGQPRLRYYHAKDD